MNWNFGARLDERQMEHVRWNLRRASERELIDCYQLYAEALKLDRDLRAATPSKIQYFVAAWRELRRRERERKAGGGAGSAA